eukprot:COSAG03_NODE_21981_length_296_cov_8.918782_1_plen_57_part_10
MQAKPEHRALSVQGHHSQRETLTDLVCLSVCLSVCGCEREGIAREDEDGDKTVVRPP